VQEEEKTDKRTEKMEERKRQRGQVQTVKKRV